MDNRICDICYLKMKNFEGEKRKGKLLKIMKSYVNKLGDNIIVAKNQVDMINEEILIKEKLIAQQSN